MAIDSALRKDITEFLIKLPSLQSKEGRQATLLSAGLQEALPHIDLSGTPYEFVARLIERLETYTTLSDGQFALICLLQEIGNQLGQDHQETLNSWCQQLQSQLKPRPIAVLKSQRPITYLAPFQAPSLPQHFVSRPEVTDALKVCLLNDEPATPGILVVSAIHGLGGIGKSTLAAALTYDKDVQERFPDGILWATLGQQPEILSLISGWIHEMRDYDFRPTTIEAASAHLRTLLQEKAVLLVVDDVWDPEHGIHFKVGGPRCQVLITTRRADVADEVGAELHQMDVMTPDQSLELLAARLQRPLETAERDEALSLAEAVGYLPLALELAAVRVARGMSWTALCEALEQETANLNALEGSPRRRRKGATTLEACFNLSLNALRSDDEDAWNAFVWLGVLPEDVQIAAPMVATLWEMEQEGAHDLLELLWNDALLLPGSPILIGDKEYSAHRLHDLLHDIARKLLTTNQLQGLGFTFQDAHATVLERYKQRIQNNLWYTLPDDGYIHAHLTWHFQQAEQVEQIHALLREETEEGRNGWYHARERLGQTAGFIENVKVALKLAGEHQCLSLQCRYALMLTSLNSLAQSIPSKLMSALVINGLWTPSQGVAYSRRIPSIAQRVVTFVELVPHLPKPLRQEILQEALLIAQANHQYAPDCISALVYLAHHLPDSLIRPAWNQVLATLQNINDIDDRVIWKIKKIAINLPYLPEPLRGETFQAVTETLNRVTGGVKGLFMPRAYLTRWIFWIQWLEDSFIFFEPEIPMRNFRREIRQWVRATLMPHLPIMVKVFMKFIFYLPIVDLIVFTNKVLRRLVLDNQDIMEYIIYIVLLTHWQFGSLSKGLVKKSLAIIYEYEKEIVLPFGWLEPYLSETLLRELVEEIEAKSGIDIEYYYVIFRAVPEFILYLPDSSRKTMLQKLLTRVQKIQKKEEQVEALTKLVPYLSDDLKEITLHAVLMAAQTIGDKDDRGQALTGLASHLPEVLLKDALTAAQGIEEEKCRAQALTGLAPHLPDALRTTALQDALTAAQAINWENERAEALTGLAPHLPEVLLKDALMAVQAMKDEHWQAKALTGMAPYLPEVLLKDALMAVQAMKDEYWRPAEALTGLAPYLPEVLLRDALMAAQAMEIEWVRAKALTGLAPHLPEVLLRDALTAAQEIENEKERAAALTGLVPHLPDGLRISVIQDALTAAQAIKDEGSRAKPLTRLAPYLPDTLRPTVLQDALTAAQAIKADGDGWMLVMGSRRAEALTRLAPHLPEVLLKDALTAAQAIKDKWDKGQMQALTGLAPHLPDALLRDALKAARAIRAVDSQAETLTGLAPHLPEVLLRDALTAAQAIKYEPSRAAALIGLVPHLPEVLRTTALQDALTMVQATEYSMGAKVLTALAPWLIEHPTADFLSTWHDLLERLAQQCDRQDLLSDLRTLTPIIAKLGGKEAIVELFHAIQDVGRWWP